MNKKILLFLLIGIFIFALGSVSAIDEGECVATYKKSSNIILYQVCDTCTYVNISAIIYPNQTVLNLNQEMTKSNLNYNYTLENTTENGRITYTVCGDKGGTVQCEDLCVLVTTSGYKSDKADSSLTLIGIIFLSVIGIAFLIGFFRENRMQYKWSMFLISLLFFLGSLNLIAINLADALINQKIASFFDSITAISLILFWGLFGLLGVIWILTLFQTALATKKAKDIEKYGGSL